MRSLLARFLPSVSLALGFLVLALASRPAAQSTASEEGVESWRAWLTTAGGPLEFGLEFEERTEGLRVYLVNEPERIPIDGVVRNERELRIEIPHYDSRILAERKGDGYHGTWRKVRGPNKLASVPFHAERGKILPPRPMVAVLPRNLAGRWAVDFSSDELPEVAVLEQAAGSNRLSGTFLTATGDYRYLAGHVSGAELTLSCFDGAHAFLFKAVLSSDGTLSGDFYSGNWWHETWTARRDDDVRVVDAFRQTTWVERASLADIAYPDPQGRLRNLGDPAFRGKAYLLQVFGSWCPNCHDEARYLVELNERYRARGLSIVALAYELTGDFERDAEQVERFKKRHGITYPVLIAGTADKGDATSALGVLDRVRSYPTTLFLSSDGRVRAIHSGFAGPATGAEHAALRKEFEERIETLLSEEEIGNDALLAKLAAQEWSVSHNAFVTDTLRFEREGTVFVAHSQKGETLPVHVLGDAVFLGEKAYRYDDAAGVLLDPTDFSVRAWPFAETRTPFFGARSDDAEFLERALASDDTVAVREAIVAACWNAKDELAEAWPRLLASESLEVRLAATWAAGVHAWGGDVPAFAQQLEHPNAMLRRQTVRTFLRLGRRSPEARARLEGLRADPDPLIRELLR